MKNVVTPFCLALACLYLTGSQLTILPKPQISGSQNDLHAKVYDDSLLQQLQDPCEGAFTVKMPGEGWCSFAGLTRAYGLIRPLGRAAEMYGSARLFFGDPAVPTYLLPQSEMKDLAADHPLIELKEVMEPAEYARMYLSQKYEGKGKLNILRSSPDAELKQILEKQAKNYPEKTFSISSVCVAYSLESDSLPMRGLSRGELNCSIVRMDDLWGVELSGFSSQADSLDLHDMLRAVLHSYEVDPSWIARSHLYQPRPTYQLFDPEDTAVHYYSVTPEAFLGSRFNDGWSYYWKDEKTGEIRPSDILENPDPSRYVRWYKGELCKRIFWE